MSPWNHILTREEIAAQALRLAGYAPKAQEREALPAEKRIDRADELLARLIDDIGNGSALDRLRKDALRIKHVLRGLDW